MAPIAIALLASLPVAGAPSARYSIFHLEAGWFLLEHGSLQMERLSLPSKGRVEQAAASPDGRHIATIEMIGDSTRLAAWDRKTNAVTWIGKDAGYYADPRFSPAGDWLYYAHNDIGRGRPAAHLGQAYAQISRAHPDGSGVTELTDERGCHYSPSPGRGRALFYVHTQCWNTERILTASDGASPPKQLLVTSDLGELTASGDGRRVAWVSRSVDTMTIESFDLRTRKRSQLRRLEKEFEPLQLVWLSPSRLLFVYRNQLWLLSGTRARPLSPFGGK